MESFDMLISILGSTIRLSIPLILAALAGLYSERAGVFDIGLEGKMLAAAFAAACVAYLTGSAWLGLFSGIAVSLVFSLIHASPRLPIAATRSSRALRSTSWRRASPSCLARRGSARVAVRRRFRATDVLRRSSCRRRHDA